MKTHITALAVLAGLFIATPAFAQDGGASGELEQSASTSPKEKIAFSQAALSEMQDSLAEVEKLLQEAERGGDPDQIQCVRKKASSIGALVEVSEGLAVKMQDALASGSDAAAEEYFRNLAVARNKTRQFRAEAEACLSSSGSTPGEVDVNVTDDGLTSSDDTDLIDAGNDEIGIDPPGASPFE